MGKFLLICYCLREIGYCFLEFLGGQGFDGGVKIIPQSPFTVETRLMLLKKIFAYAQ